MNLADSERMAGVLESAGYKCEVEANKADVVVFNTCSIRDKAEHKVYSAMGKHVWTQLMLDRAPLGAEGLCMQQAVLANGPKSLLSNSTYVDSCTFFA